AARLVVGHARSCARIVGLLGLPGDDTALDIDFPRTRAGAVHAVGRSDDLVVLPALPVALLPHAILVAQLAVAGRKRLATPGKIGEAFEEVAHSASPRAGVSGLAGPGQPSAFAHYGSAPHLGHVVED